MHLHGLSAKRRTPGTPFWQINKYSCFLEFGNENALKISVNENTASGNTSLWVNPGETLTFALTNFPIDKNSTYLNGSEVITEKAVLHEYEVSYSYNKTSWNFL